MALLVIVDSQGKEHLIHSSQIGQPSPLPPKSSGQWEAVWAQFQSAQTEPKKDER